MRFRALTLAEAAAGLRAHGQIGYLLRVLPSGERTALRQAGTRRGSCAQEPGCEPRVPGNIVRRGTELSEQVCSGRSAFREGQMDPVSAIGLSGLGLIWIGSLVYLLEPRPTDTVSSRHTTTCRPT